VHRLNPGRHAAILYLSASAPGFFSYMVVMPSLTVYRDAAATARNILASETLFRLAIVAELVSSIAFIFLVLSLYRIFRNVDGTKAIAMVILVLVSIPVSLLNAANLVAVLRLLKGGPSFAAIDTAQLQAMALLFLRVHDAGIIIAQIFWGLWLLPLGMLVRRSGFIPRILGTLLIFNGLAYPIVTLIWLLAPSYVASASRLALIPQMGEAWFILWLLVKGVPARTPAATEPPHGICARPALAGAMLIAIASLCATAGAQTNDAQALYERGRGALEHGRPEQAVKDFADAIALRPNVAQYHCQLGNAYAESAPSAGMFERVSLAKNARAEWERSVQLDPNLLAARQSLVDFYLVAPAMMGGSNAAALEQATEIRKRDAIEGHRAFARIHTAANRPDLARNEYAEMLKTYGGSARAHYWHGVYLLATEKNYRAAALEFETAVKLDPSYMPAYFRIGQAAALSGDSLPRGEDALKKYLGTRPKEGEPSIARAHYWLGSIYEKERRQRDAKASYSASLTINPNQKDVQEASKRVSQ